MAAPGPIRPSIAMARGMSVAESYRSRSQALTHRQRSVPDLAHKSRGIGHPITPQVSNKSHAPRLERGGEEVETFDDEKSDEDEKVGTPDELSPEARATAAAVAAASAAQDEPILVCGGKYWDELDPEMQQVYGSPKDMLKVKSDIPLTQLEKVEYKGKDWILLKFVDDDKEDPFNWSGFRKGYITAILCLMTLFVGLATTAYSSGVNSMVKDLHSTPEIGQLGLFLFNFVCAIAPLFLAPFCELAGRYIVYVGAYLCFCLCFIGLALGKNMATILVLRALLGLFGCVGTILVGGTFSDIYRSHERAIPMALFTFVAIFGTVGAPVYAGFIDMTIGWRWIQGIQGLANIPLLVCTVAFLRETRGGVVLQKRAKTLRQELDCKDYWAEVDLASSSVKDMLHEASVKAVRMLATEPVVFAFGLWIAFAWFLTFLFLSVIPITFAEKRNWNEGVAGLPYISLCIGTTIAFFLNFFQIRKYQSMEDRAREGRRGSMFDKFTSTGAPVPEVRLYGAMFGSIWLPIGLFIYSFTQYADLTWVGPAIALAPIAVGIFFIFEATYSYTSDCYGENAGSAIAGQGLMRNLFGAVSPLFGSQFFHNVGSQYAGLLLALIALLLTFIPFVFYKYGNKLRERSKMAPT